MSKPCRMIGVAAFILLPATLITIPASGLPATAQAADLSLAVAVERARAEHPRIAAALAAREAAGHRAEQAGKWPNPHVAVVQETFPGASPDADQTIVSLGQRLRMAGQPGLARRAGEALERATGLEAELTRQRLVLEVQRAYAAAFRVQRAVAAVDEARQVVAGLVGDLEARLPEGDVSRFDVERMRLEDEELQARRARRLGELRSGLERLAFLMGRPVPDGGWTLADPAGDAAGPPVVGAGGVPGTTDVEGGTGGVDGRYDLQALRARRDAAELRAELARRERIPDLAVSLGYSRLDPALDGLVWSVTATLPILDDNDAARAAEAADARRLAREHETAAAEARAAARGALLQFEEMERILAGTGREATAREPLLPMARIAYEEGEMTVTGLLDAAEAQLEAALRRADLEYLRADAWFRWRHASGRYVGEDGR